jgi:hypothetical protein
VTSFTVDRSQLDAASVAFKTLDSSATGTQATLKGVGLVQSDFGRVPWLETRVWEAYHQHTSDCRDALGELISAMGNVSAGLAATSATYRVMDSDAEKAAEYISQSLAAGPA